MRGAGGGARGGARNGASALSEAVATKKKGGAKRGCAD